MDLVFVDLEIFKGKDLVMIRKHLMEPEDSRFYINILVDTVSQS
jgi:hypothetical protein